MMNSSEMAAHWPELYRHVSKDKEFSFQWRISSRESLEYFGKLLGREVKDSDSVSAVMDEIEEKLSSQADETK